MFANQCQVFGQRADLAVCGEPQREIEIGPDCDRLVEPPDLFDQGPLHEDRRDCRNNLESQHEFKDVSG